MFVQERQKPQSPLDRPRELVVACPPMRSHVNLSRIARAAGCCGIERMICCGNAKLIGKIARDVGAEEAELRILCGEQGPVLSAADGSPAPIFRFEVHRTLPPVLEKLREQGFEIVGLEQTTGAASLFEFRFQRQTVLVLGNERTGIEEEVLRLVDRAVEIPVYGRPLAHNVATAAAMALYEYCRQYPRG